ncbi:MAG: hypothetical protein ACE5GO_05160 [Anaerolineales bacterium]
MEDKITIIEGPIPTFETINEEWVLGLSDSATLSELAITRLRTFNGASLIERCHRSWQNQQPIHLEYRTPEGLHQQAQIVAARSIEVDEGDILILWVRLPDEGVEIEIGYEDDADDEEDGFFGLDSVF